MTQRGNIFLLEFFCQGSVHDLNLVGCSIDPKCPVPHHQSHLWIKCLAMDGFRMLGKAILYTGSPGAIGWQGNQQVLNPTLGIRFLWVTRPCFKIPLLLIIFVQSGLSPPIPSRPAFQHFTHFPEIVTTSSNPQLPSQPIPPTPTQSDTPTSGTSTASQAPNPLERNGRNGWPFGIITCSFSCDDNSL